MIPVTEKMVRDFEEAARELRKENNSREKARAFLLKAGIVEPHKGSPNGVRLAKHFRRK